MASTAAVSKSIVIGGGGGGGGGEEPELPRWPWQLASTMHAATTPNLKNALPAFMMVNLLLDAAG
jgi:hypothetical protein